VGLTLSCGILPVLKRVISYLLAAIVVASAPALARAKDLNSLHAQIMRDPTNTELNLQYARLAEASGTLRWALAAYERILLNDPLNEEARRGMQRVLRSLQPSFTLATLELGVAYESNPRYYQGPKVSEALGLGSLTVRDERYLFDTRWRTAFQAAGQIRSRNEDLSYGYVGLETGPLIALWNNVMFNPALGGGAAYFDNHFYYSEASASGTFESVLNGSPQTVRMRAAYRKYDDHFPSNEGWYADIRGRFSAQGVLGDSSIVFLSPWVLWSDIRGGVSNALVTELQPGAYLEFGSKIEVYKALAPWLTIGGNVGVARRNYRTDVVAGTSDHREDTIWSPGATLVFPNAFGNQSDLRLDYKYIDTRSNDPSKSFTDHIASATVVTRFNPFAMQGPR
jgi:hypothetical protein